MLNYVNKIKQFYKEINSLENIKYQKINKEITQDRFEEVIKQKLQKNSKEKIISLIKGFYFSIIIFCYKTYTYYIHQIFTYLFNYFTGNLDGKPSVNNNEINQNKLSLDLDNNVHSKSKMLKTRN